MKTIKFIVSLAAVVSTLLLVGCSSPSKPVPPEAVNGVIDLSDWDFERDGPVELKGAWGVRIPGNGLGSELQQFSRFVAIPSDNLKLASSEPPYLDAPYYRSGDFSLLVKLPKHDSLAITSGRIIGAAIVGIQDQTGKSRILELGTFSPRPSEMRAGHYSYDAFEIDHTWDREMLVNASVSTEFHPRGGIWQSPSIMTHEQLRWSQFSTLLVNGILIGILIITSLYHIIIFLQRPSERPLLHFALLCLMASVREFTTSGIAYQVLQHQIDSSYSVSMRIEYASMPGSIFGLLFFYTLFPAKWLNIPVRLLSAISVVLVCATLGLSTVGVAEMKVVYQLHAGAIVALIMIHLFRVAVQNKPFARGSFILVVLYSLSFINDILYSNEVIYTAFVVPYAIAIFVLGHAALISKKFSQAMDERDAKSRELLSTYQQLDDELLKRESLEASNAQLELENQAAAQQLIQADKLATMGTLVAGVAHDIANPTGLIMGSTTLMDESRATLRRSLYELLRDSTSDEAMAIKAQFTDLLDGLDDETANIRLGANRIKAINGAIRNQSRSDSAPSMENLHALIDECLTVVGHRLTGIDVEVRCSEGLDVEVIRSQFGQVLMNLLANASDAITEQGADGLRRIVIGAEPRSDNRFAVTVDDSGPGIPEDIRAKILEPFFTTKAVGKGTGLGMPIVLRIVEAHQMSLSIEDSPELGGARFVIEPEQS